MSLSEIGAGPAMPIEARRVQFFVPAPFPSSLRATP